ncbi:MAG: hypothetical protein OES38_14070 [Gammaproteobacteria bacterium]|nr:hypothetical protein [Gammaproteobacteria bacterium]
MPITYEVDETRSLTVTTLVGEVSREEIFAYYEQFMADTRCRSCTKSLIDLTSSIPVDGSPDWMQSISARSDPTTNVTRMAVIAPDDLRYGLSRAYEAYVDDQAVATGVFRNRSEAEAWLDL